MRRRPLCVALGMYIFLILIFRGKLDAVKERQYQGEQKTLQCQVEEIDGQGESVSLSTGDVMENGKPLCRRIKLYQGRDGVDFTDVRIGNILLVTGKIYSFSQPGNPGQFNEYQYYRNQGISCKMSVQSLKITDKTCRIVEQWLHDVRTALYQRIMLCLPEEEAGVAAAMVLGEKSALTDETRTLYQESGIAHLLAISGLHISLIGMGLFAVLRRYVIPMRAAAVVTAAVLFLYGELTGFSVSAQRAVWMMFCYLAAYFLGERYDVYCALALSAFLQLLMHPLVLFEAGFMLSYGTVFGIAVFVEDFQKQAEESKNIFCSAVIRAFLGSLGIQIVTLPVLLYYYFEFNPYSALINVIVLPFVGILLCMSFLGSLSAFLSVQTGNFLFGIVHFILYFYTYVGELIQFLPMASCITGRPAWWQILIYYGFLSVWVSLSRSPSGRKAGSLRTWISCGLLVSAFILLLVPAPDRGKLQITNLDVGQGDCCCIRYADKTILIDGGSSDVGSVGKYRICSYLKYYGIRKLDYIFITHSDSDHSNGILEILQKQDYMGFQIGTLVLPEIEKTDKDYLIIEQICRERSILVKKMKKGDGLAVGDLKFRCLHPFRAYNWQTKNDYSLILELQYKDFRGLFTGDLEQAGEKQIMDQIGDVDYLKVGHHGSAGSDGEEFLAILKPEIAVISAGEGNRYGHPAPETLDRLRRTGADIYSTMDNGAITVKIQEGKWNVSTFRSTFRP